MAAGAPLGACRPSGYGLTERFNTFLSRLDHARIGIVRSDLFEQFDIIFGLDGLDANLGIRACYFRQKEIAELHILTSFPVAEGVLAGGLTPSSRGDFLQTLQRFFTNFGLGIFPCDLVQEFRAVQLFNGFFANIRDRYSLGF